MTSARVSRMCSKRIGSNAAHSAFHTRVVIDPLCRSWGATGSGGEEGRVGAGVFVGTTGGKGALGG